MIRSSVRPSRRVLSRFARQVGLAVVAMAMVAWAVQAAPRIVAVGDVHGAADNLTEILQATALVDEEGRWAGGDAILVQMGDLMDRGPQVREVFDLLMRLQEEADAAGGRVEVLLGNHEAMNLLGIRRDVNAESYSAFADDQSRQRIEAAWETYAEYQISRARAAGRIPPDFRDADRAAWVDAHPLGWLEFVEAFSADGRYGEWLRERPVAVEIDGTLFVHGGISEEVQGMGPEALNTRLRRELGTWDETFAYMVGEGLLLPWSSVQDAAPIASAALQAKAGSLRSVEARGLRRHAHRLGELRGMNDWFLLSPDGPLWFRGPAVWDEVEDVQLVHEILDGYGVERMVIAHSTVADGRISTRFDSRIVLIDTGMLGPPYYPQGRPSALEIVGDQLRALYVGDSEPLVVSTTEADAVADLESMRIEMVASAPPPRPAGEETGEPALGSSPESESESSVETDPAWGGYIWRDVDGEPLPDQDEPHLLWILRAGEIVDGETLTSGTTGPRKLVVELDGIRVHAVFRFIDQAVRDVRGLRSTETFNLRDRGLHELAAYRVDRMLGMRRVPPVVRRQIDGRDGTLQLWLEGVMREMDRRDQELRAPDPAVWSGQLAIMHVFDALIGNYDRNQGNILIDDDWRVWLIDHTRAFLRTSRLIQPEKIQRCERRLYRALRDLDGEVVGRRLREVLGRHEIESLMERREALVDRIRGLIIERGEDAVLFDLGDPNLDTDEILGELEQILRETGPVQLPPDVE